MHLPKPFFKLPRTFDAERLRDEVAAIPSEVWVPHPNGIAGNSSVRLISVDGGENDLVDGIMRETEHMARTPYIRQILASFRVPWSRSRLLRLAPGAGVPAHADINYHWFNRVRLHVPVKTRPEVRFHCAEASVHMASGEAWVFDNWRLHNVVNPTPDERIHLVADTAGSAAFWQLVGSGEDANEPVQHIGYDPGAIPTLLTERSLLRPVMNPAELELLVGNLRGELISSSDSGDVRQRLGRYHGLLDSFVRDWRQFYMLHGEDPSGWAEFEALRERVRAASRVLGEGIVLGTNHVAAHKVLEGRVLRVCLSAGTRASRSSTAVAPIRDSAPAGRGSLTKPVFIVAAPRSGSTLLFETIAASDQVATLGGEAHWLIETIADLCPGAPGVDSNRLLARQATPQVRDRIQNQILERLVDQAGTPLRGGRVLTLLEKTPKNALRIPFLNQIFPDARFIFLWREPRANISSIMEAWRAGKWQTYPRLEGFPLPWSLLLPPGWQVMRGKTLEEIAAFQWNVTNRVVLDDLALVPKERWTAVDYDSFLANPSQAIRSICRFLGLAFDAELAKRVSGPLPPAKHTLTAADPQKWIRNQPAIEHVLPLVEPTWRRLIDLAGQSPK
jgi:Sulfotransferase family/Aspartyl/Asparaginyl beta-hydroxylase